MRIHPQVKRSFNLHREPARRVVQLHGGNLQVGENAVGPNQARLDERVRQAAELLRMAVKRPVQNRTCAAGPRLSAVRGIGIKSRRPAGEFAQGASAWPPYPRGIIDRNLARSGCRPPESRP